MHLDEPQARAEVQRILYEQIGLYELVTPDSREPGEEITVDMPDIGILVFNEERYTACKTIPLNAVYNGKDILNRNEISNCKKKFNTDKYILGRGISAMDVKIEHERRIGEFWIFPMQFYRRS